MKTRWPPALSIHLADADQVDVKRVKTSVSLREFAAAFFSYSPGWMRFLFRVRGWLAWLLRLRHPSSRRQVITPREVSFTSGAQQLFFTVVAGEENRYLLLKSGDTHLTGYLAMIATPADDGYNYMEVVTIVHYQSWKGPLYFNLIRPFHHLVVRAMAKTGARGWHPD